MDKSASMYFGADKQPADFNSFCIEYSTHHSIAISIAFTTFLAECLGCPTWEWEEAGSISCKSIFKTNVMVIRVIVHSLFLFFFALGKFGLLAVSGFNATLTAKVGDAHVFLGFSHQY